MGQFGPSTYDCDLVWDALVEYEIEITPSENKSLPLDIKERLSQETNWLKVLGIASYLRDNYNATADIIGKENLKRAFFISENFLKDINYAASWLKNWSIRLKVLKVEMKNIYKLLYQSKSFDFSKYEKISPDEIYDLNNWDKINDEYKLYVFEEWYHNPKKEVINILKEEIVRIQKTKCNLKDLSQEPSSLVLAALALSKVDNLEDIENILIGNMNRSYKWVRELALEYFKQKGVRVPKSSIPYKQDLDIDELFKQSDEEN